MLSEPLPPPMPRLERAKAGESPCLRCVKVMIGCSGKKGEGDVLVGAKLREAKKAMKDCAGMSVTVNQLVPADRLFPETVEFLKETGETFSVQICTQSQNDALMAKKADVALIFVDSDAFILSLVRTIALVNENKIFSHGR